MYIYWDTDFDTVECACDGPGWSPLYTYTLTDAPAGRAVAAAAPETEADPPANEAAPETPQAERPAPAPLTGDANFIYIIIVAAAAVFAALRKKTKVKPA